VYLALGSLVTATSVMELSSLLPISNCMPATKRRDRKYTAYQTFWKNDNKHVRDFTHMSGRFALPRIGVGHVPWFEAGLRAPGQSCAQHWEYIRVIEYTNVMHDVIRRFKAEIFQALAHPTRIAILELLRDRELPAGKLIEQLGIEQANASQHLAVLRSKQIVVNRKEGNQVFYSLRNPVLKDVLEMMRLYCQAHITEARIALGEIERGQTSARKAAKR